MDEDEYDKEFDQLIEEYEKCPECSKPPIKVGSTRQTDESGVEDEEFLLWAECANGHLYSVERRFDI